MINRPPDAEVILYLDPTEAGGKTRSVISGYRPVVAIKDHYLTSTHFELLDSRAVATGGQVRANVWFITPELYPKCLWSGRNMIVSEGARKVGTVNVVKVFNPVLVGINHETSGFLAV